MPQQPCSTITTICPTQYWAIILPIAANNVEAILQHPALQGVSVFCGQRIQQLLVQQSLSLALKPICLGITGGSGSGKSQVAWLIQAALAPFLPVTILSQDNYYRDFEADFPTFRYKIFTIKSI